MTLWTISTLGIVNMLYTNYFFEHSFSIMRLAFFQGVTFLVAFSPVTFYIMMKQMILLKRNLAETEKISNNLNYKKRLQGFSDATVEIISENKKENLVLKVCDIIYITSADNYVEVYFLDDGIVKSKLIRTSLKAVRENLKLYTAFYRCHRAWIVNLDQVKRVTGNAQGYRLILNFGDVEIPVSRNLNEEITNRLSK
jgi:DNA-binding LytR/AlgR family response regulator